MDRPDFVVQVVERSEGREDLSSTETFFVLEALRRCFGKPEYRAHRLAFGVADVCAVAGERVPLGMAWGEPSGSASCVGRSDMQPILGRDILGVRV